MNKLLHRGEHHTEILSVTGNRDCSSLKGSPRASLKMEEVLKERQSPERLRRAFKEAETKHIQVKPRSRENEP